MINTSTLVPIGSSRIPDWVSGGSYVVNDQVMSPITFLAYVRKTNGGGVTDPSADTTNWTPFGLTIKQIIKGTIALSGVTSNTATVAAVVTTRSIISILGAHNSSTAATGARVELTNSTTVTAYQGAGSGSGITTVGYQIVEYY